MAIAVFGIGNSLRGDDGVALQIIERLRRKFPQGGVRFYSVMQLLPEDIAELKDVQYVLFIDASVQISPGDYTIRPIQKAENPTSKLSHQLTPDQFLLLAYNLMLIEPKASLLEIGAWEFDPSDSLSNPMLAIVDRIEAEASRWIREHQSQTPFSKSRKQYFGDPAAS